MFLQIARRPGCSFGSTNWLLCQFQQPLAQLQWDFNPAQL
jgi:hypothetical protein